MRSVSATAVLVAVLIGLSFPAASSAAKHPRLPERYEHWLDQEVPYLITDAEKNSFRALTTDESRDRFIQTFWAIRNPDPAAPNNAVRDEYYRRLDYANTHYGLPSAQNGWHTDRGMVYITLGPPQLKRSYADTTDLVPFETWFYQDPASALAPYFSVLFFKPSAAEDFKIYSPYQDRPEKLVASTNAVNDERAALKIIKQSVGNDVANLTLSLFPNEPVDNINGTPTLESDVPAQQNPQLP